MCSLSKSPTSGFGAPSTEQRAQSKPYEGFDASAPIGVFDSGMGGLTVLRALEAAMPGQSFIYLGDTARLPYGTKSPVTVERYALRASRELVSRGVGALVIACNTASAVALDALRSEYSEIPVFGVVEPGAAAACAVVGVKRIAVFATESTVRGHAYQRALLSRQPQLMVRGRACQLLVALAEEGWVEGQVPEAAMRAYLAGLLDWSPDVLLLGCTHFPVFRQTLQRLAGDGVVLVDSAATTAKEVARSLSLPVVSAPSAQPANLRGDRTLLATDDIARFRRVGSYFLGEPIDKVELVDL